MGPDRQLAWHVLGTVLRTLRDRVPAPLAAHLGAQLPLLVRGAYYAGYAPETEPQRLRGEGEFLGRVQEDLSELRPLNARDAVTSVFSVLSAHLPRGQCEKVRQSLPQELQALWQLDEGMQAPVKEHAAAGRAAQNAADARAYRARRK